MISYVLPNSLTDTVLLMLGVGIGTATIGTGTAWLVTMCRFPGRSVLSWLLVMPLAVPSYIAAYCYVEILDFSGPFQTAVRELFGFKLARDYWFPDVRSLTGASMLLSLVLYPYVYLASRLVFSMQGASMLDAARSLGAGPHELFFRVAVPLARPAIAAGVILALLETLNDVGAVEALGVYTLTFAIFDTWLNKGSLPGAAQLALMVLAVVLVLIALERVARRNRQYSGRENARPPAPFELKGFKAVLALIATTTPVIAGLLGPLVYLTSAAFRRVEQINDPELISAAMNSVVIAIIAGFLTVVIAFTTLSICRQGVPASIQTLSRFLTFGYAVPGTVLAIGVFVPMAALDNLFDGWMRSLFGISTGLLISGGAAIIVFACTVRFLAVPLGTIEAGFSRVSRNIDHAGRLLGTGRTASTWKLHLPIMRKALAVAGLLVFVESMKELSATILLRPFNFNTLATFVYERASLAIFEDASIAALTIVLIGIIPVALLTRATDQSRSNS
ncbi:MAG: iron ABC transporter permease [Pseudomonadota bacterium]